MPFRKGKKKKVEWYKHEWTDISLILNMTMEKIIKWFSYCRVKIKVYKYHSTQFAVEQVMLSKIDFTYN